jgi:Ca2+-binding EF-hand superfamily protein
MKTLTTLLAVVALSAFTANVNAQEKGKAKMNPEEAFKKKDANGDGKLSKEEFTKNKDATKAEGLAKQFDVKDKNKDGSLDLEEFKAGGKPKKPKAQ